MKTKIKKFPNDLKPDRDCIIVRLPMGGLNNNPYGNPFGLGEDEALIAHKTDRRVCGLLRAGALELISRYKERMVRKGQTEEKEVDEKKVRMNTKGNFAKLLAIKGIGKKAVSDLQRQFKTFIGFLEALKKDGVSLRDDQVEILKKELTKDGRK